MGSRRYKFAFFWAHHHFLAHCGRSTFSGAQQQPLVFANSVRTKGDAAARRYLLLIRAKLVFCLSSRQVCNKGASVSLSPRAYRRVPRMGERENKQSVRIANSSRSIWMRNQINVCVIKLENYLELFIQDEEYYYKSGLWNFWECSFYYLILFLL